MHDDGCALRWLSLAAGLCLVPLLPLGTEIGFGWVYNACFLLHLSLLALACVASLRIVAFRCSARSLSAILIGTYITLALPLLIVMGLLPVTSTDALVHHLAVPKWWVESGSIFEIKWHEWSYYPMLVSLGYAGLMSLGVWSGFGLYHLAFFVVLLGLVVSTVTVEEDRFSSRTALLAAVTLPVLLRLASLPLVDIGLAVFAFGSVRHLQCYLRTSHESELLGAGIALGLAMSVKYNGMLFAAIFVTCLAVLVLARRLSVRDLVLCGVVAAVVVSPWLFKNFVWTGNPVYPLMRGIFGPHSVAVSGGPRSFTPLQHRIAVYGESYLDLVVLPFRIFLSGVDRVPSMFDGSLSPFLLLGAIATLLTQEIGAKVLLGWSSIAYILTALVTSPARVRYLIPAIPALCVQTGFYTNRALAPFKIRTRKIVCGLYTAALLIFGISYIDRSLFTPDVRAYLRGELSEEQYKILNVPEFGLIQLINRDSPADSRVYLIGTSNPFYYFERDVLSRGYFSTNEIIGWLRSGAVAADIGAKFREMKISHLLVNHERLQTALTSMLTAEQLNEWNAFASKTLEGIASSGGFSLWRIRGE